MSELKKIIIPIFYSFFIVPIGLFAAIFPASKPPTNLTTVIIFSIAFFCLANILIQKINPTPQPAFRAHLHIAGLQYLILICSFYVYSSLVNFRPYLECSATDLLCAEYAVVVTVIVGALISIAINALYLYLLNYKHFFYKRVL